jgi:hypothetical protein
MSGPSSARPADAAVVEAALNRLSVVVQRALARVMAAEQEERAAGESGEKEGAAAPRQEPAAPRTSRSGVGYACHMPSNPNPN